MRRYDIIYMLFAITAGSYSARRESKNRCFYQAPYVMEEILSILESIRTGSVRAGYSHSLVTEGQSGQSRIKRS